LLRADLHLHTAYSFDCRSALEGIIERCLKVGINCVAVADHGTIKGALKLKEIAPFRVIVAEEVLTPIGEIMGMFLTEEVPSNISPEEAIARIKAQDGLVCIPHPFDWMRGLNHRFFSLDTVAADIDVVEVYNARALPLPFADKKARNFAGKHDLLCSAGSDAHTLLEIGRTYVELPDFDSVAEFRQALSQGRIHGRRSSPLVHLFSTWHTFLENLRGKNAHHV